LFGERSLVGIRHSHTSPGATDALKPVEHWLQQNCQGRQQVARP